MYEAYLAGTGVVVVAPTLREAQEAVLRARQGRKGDAIVFDPQGRIAVVMADGLWREPPA